MPAAAPHIVYHLVLSENHIFTPSPAWTPRLSGSVLVPSSPHQHPWGFSFIAQNSISYLRPMKITVRHQFPPPALVTFSPRTLSLNLCLCKIHQVLFQAHVSLQLGYAYGGESAPSADHLGAKGECCSLCACARLLDGDPAVHRWARGSFCL